MINIIEFLHFVIISLHLESYIYVNKPTDTQLQNPTCMIHEVRDINIQTEHSVETGEACSALSCIDQTHISLHYS